VLSFSTITLLIKKTIIKSFHKFPSTHNTIQYPDYLTENRTNIKEPYLKARGFPVFYLDTRVIPGSSKPLPHPTTLKLH